MTVLSDDIDYGHANGSRMNGAYDMDFWRVYDYLVNVVHNHMNNNNQCLYNSLVLTMASMSTDEMIRVRNSAYSLITMIDEEIQARQNEKDEE